MASNTSLGNTTEVPPLTSEQRSFLKQHWGSEFNFLQSYNLSIYKDEDRLEGHEILKAFMEAEEEEGEG
jgi:hypothetical protein